MSLCTVCGKYLCDHSPEERGQTIKEMVRPLTENELKAWESGDETKKKNAAIETQIHSRRIESEN